MKPLLFAAFAFLFFVHTAQAQDTIRFKACTKLWKDNVPLNGTNVFVKIDKVGSYVMPTGPNANCADLVVPIAGLSGETFVEIGAEKVNSNDEASKWFNGVSVRDLLLIQQHIYGLEPLPSPYAIINADANKSNSITTLDVVEFRKLILGEYPLGLPNNTVWRFFPEYYTFTDPTNPFVGGFLELYSVNKLKNLNNKSLFVLGAKTGDVDGDVSLSKPYTGPTMTDTIDLVIPDITVQPDTAIIVPVYLGGNKKISGLQLSIVANNAKITGIALAASPQLTLSTFKPATPAFPKDRMRLVLGINSVTMPNGFATNSAKPFFNLKISTTVPLILRDAIRLLPNDLPSFAVGSLSSSTANENYVFRLKFDGTLSDNTIEKHTMNFENPSPNPFTDKTLLKLELPQKEDVLLEVFDLNGRLTWSSEQTLGEGWQSLEIPADALPMGGMGMFRARAGGQVATGRLVRW